MTAAAALDPESRRIVGYVAPAGGRPGRAVIRVDDRVAVEVLAAGPATLLAPEIVDRLGPPPEATCAFAACLPAASRPAAGAPARLRVETGDGRTILEATYEDGAALARYVEGATMADGLSLRILRLSAGAFRGRLTVAGGGAPPAVELRLNGEVVGAAEFRDRDGETYEMKARLPPEAIGDGVHVVAFTLPGGETLARYPISAGEALAGDLAAEVATLRAELDHLKSAFRATLGGGVIPRDERPMMIAEVLAHVDNLLEMRDRAARTVENEPGEEEEDEWMIRE